MPMAACAEGGDQHHQIGPRHRPGHLIQGIAPVFAPLCAMRHNGARLHPGGIMVRRLRSLVRAFAVLAGLFGVTTAFCQTCPAGHTCTPTIKEYGQGDPHPWFSDPSPACALALNGVSAIIPVPNGEVWATHTNCTSAGIGGFGNYDCSCTDVAVDGSMTVQQITPNVIIWVSYCPVGTHRDRDICISNQPTQPQCPVAALTPITDPIALQHENGQYSGGHPDLDHVTQATRDGTACIVQHALAQAPGTNVHPTSGFRPPAYQQHIREVWDKWQQLQNNNNPACGSLKEAVHTEWMKHGPFAHQPGATSNHSSGKAVDIGGVPQGNADAIGSQCNMRRPVPNDRVHYEPN
ncbi:hypothetical protein GO290_03500 [Ralstonia solanacearum]|nr:hypothetical protein [Ralstonia solanacearum]